MPIPNELHNLDVRLQRRNLRSGKITQEQLDAHLAGLPDEAEEAVPAEAKFVHHETDDDGDEGL